MFLLLSQCFIISWNQRGILNSKWIQIPMFIVSTFFAVSSVPLYRWHRYIDTPLTSQKYVRKSEDTNLKCYCFCAQILKCCRGQQIFQKPESNLPILSTRRLGMEQVPYWRHAVFQWPVNLTSNCPLVPCTCVLSHIFMCKGKSAITVRENIRRYGTECSRLGFVYSLVTCEDWIKTFKDRWSLFSTTRFLTFENSTFCPWCDYKCFVWISE